MEKIFFLSGCKTSLPFSATCIHFAEHVSFQIVSPTLFNFQPVAYTLQNMSYFELLAAYTQLFSLSVPFPVVLVWPYSLVAVLVLIRVKKGRKSGCQAYPLVVQRLAYDCELSFYCMVSYFMRTLYVCHHNKLKCKKAEIS